MTEWRSEGPTRRQMMALSAASLVGLGFVNGRGVGAQRTAIGGAGIAGGGLVETADGEAQFSLFGSRLLLEGDDEPTFFGRVQWLDPSWQGRGITLESTEITRYGPPEDDPDVRELRGAMSVDGAGSYPFVLRALDAGGPGEGRDTIVLTVGPEAMAGTPSAATPADDFAYAVEATVSAGDLQLLSFDEPGQG